MGTATRQFELEREPVAARAVVCAVAGPLLMGSALGLAHGPSAALVGAIGMGALVGGLAAIMLPALYIGSAFAGQAPEARQVLEAAGEALREMGVLLVGLSPALAFLLVTAGSDGAQTVLSMLVVALGAAMGLRAFFTRLCGGQRPQPAMSALYLAWAGVCMGLGAQGFLHILESMKEVI